MAGYTDYRIESRIIKKDSGEEITPDIIASSTNGWLVVELTCNIDSKTNQLNSDKNADPRTLSVYGLGKHNQPPDTISSRLSLIDDGNHCQIIVKDSFDVQKEEQVQEQNLREALIHTKGKNLSQLPEIPICFVPESKHFEIRRGLIDIVIQIFNPNCDGKTPYQMCQEGLERLSDKTSSSAIKGLTSRIEAEMDNLIKTELNGFIELKDGKYCATGHSKEHPKTREFISKRLQDWANPRKRTLDDFTK